MQRILLLFLYKCTCMRNLADILFEAKSIPQGFAKFDKYQKYAIEKALAKRGATKISFKLDKNRTSIQKITAKVIPGNYPKIELSYDDPRYGNEKYTGQFFIHDKGISANPAMSELSTKNVIDFSYDESKNITTLTFAESGLGINSDWRRIYGTITFKFEGNCVAPEAEKLEFDGKKFVEFMKKYLPTKKDYLDSFEWDDEIEDCQAYYSEEKKELYIEIRRTCGKGYSNHFRSTDYKFEHDGTQYLSADRRMLPDANHEAQLVRKFRSGVMDYIGSRLCPQYLTIHIEQELD